MIILPHEYQALYLQYLNDFLTISRLAEYIGMHEKRVNRMINKGRILFNDTFGLH